MYDERDSFTNNIGPSASQPGNVANGSQRVNLAYRALDGRFNANLRTEYFDWKTDNNAVKNRTDARHQRSVHHRGRRAFVHEPAGPSRQRRNCATASPTAWICASCPRWQRGKTEDQTDGDRTATALPQPPTANVGRVAFARTRFSTWIYELNLLSTGEGPCSGWRVPSICTRACPGLRCCATTAHHRFRRLEFDHHHRCRQRVEVRSSARSMRSSRTGGADRRRALFQRTRSTTTASRCRARRCRRAPTASARRRLPMNVTGKARRQLPHVTDDLDATTARSRKGYKAGGVNLTLGTPNFEPETNTRLRRRRQVHAGSTGACASTALCSIRTTRTSSSPASSTRLPLTQNAASGEAWGAELEAHRPLRRLRRERRHRLARREFAKDASHRQHVTNVQTLVPKGSDLPFSPDFTINAGVDYGFQLGNGTLVPRVQWSLRRAAAGNALPQRRPPSCRRATSGTRA